MTPLISVIIPIYNVELYLNECIESVINQTYNNLEIILVDDGSTDNSSCLCEAWAQKDKRIKVIHKENAGLGKARNSGLMIATGDYVTFLDSDDFIDNDLYSYVVPILEQTKADCLKFGMTNFCNNKDLEKKKRSNQINLISDSNTIRLIAKLIFEYYPSPELNKYHIDASCCWGIFKRSIIQEHNISFPSERELLSEDYVFHFDYLMHTSSLVFCENTYYHYRVNYNSLSKKIDLTRLTRAQNLCMYIKNRMKFEGYTRKDFEILDSYYICMLLLTYNSIVKNFRDIRKRKKLLDDLLDNTYTTTVLDRFSFNKLNYKDKFTLNIIKNRKWNNHKYLFIINFLFKVSRKIKTIFHDLFTY